MARHSPNNDPKFHQAEILLGAGRSTRALLIILIRGCLVRKVNISWDEALVGGRAGIE